MHATTETCGVGLEIAISFGSNGERLCYFIRCNTGAILCIVALRMGLALVFVIPAAEFGGGDAVEMSQPR
jgi:hypothetical protein